MDGKEPEADFKVQVVELKFWNLGSKDKCVELGTPSSPKYYGNAHIKSLSTIGTRIYENKKPAKMKAQIRCRIKIKCHLITAEYLVNFP